MEENSKNEKMNDNSKKTEWIFGELPVENHLFARPVRKFWERALYEKCEREVVCC